MGLWIALGIIVLGALGSMWYYIHRPLFFRRRRWPDDFSAPQTWYPPLYFGPGRNESTITRTPKGIRVYTSGFNEINLPIMKYGINARVSLSGIDRIWMKARVSLCGSNAPAELTKDDIIKIARLPDDFPIVMIEPTIWWSKNKKQFTDRESLYGDFLGKTSLVVMACVWYRTVYNRPPIIVSWAQILEDEFKDAILLYIGREDVKLAKK